MKKTLGKIFYFFDRRGKFQLLVLFVLVLIGSVFEMVGIGLVFPFIGLISSPGQINDQPLLAWFYSMLGQPSINVFLLWIGGGIICFFVAKNFYLGVVYYLQNRFVYNKEAVLSRRLYTTYLRSPYTIHLQRNSAELLQNLTIEVQKALRGVILTGITVLTEIIILTSIIILLVLVDPVSSLSAAVILGVMTLIFYYLMQQRMNALGKSTQYHQKQALQQIQQGLGSIKEIIILNRSEFFLNSYTKHSYALADNLKILNLAGHLPRLFIETIGVVGLLTIIIVYLFRGENLNLLLPTLALFAAAAFRMMPSANRLLAAIGQIRFHLPAVDVIYRDFVSLEKLAKTYPAKTITPLTFQQGILVEEVDFQYPEADDLTLCNISLHIKKGTMVGFVGATGSGKTTLIDMVLGLLPPTCGTVSVDGQDIQTNMFGWQQQIGYIPQNIYLSDDSLRNNVAFGVPDQEVDDELVWEALRSAQLSEFAQNLTDGLDTFVGERGVRISGGQRQRVGIARALYHNPAVLVMDEATAALDNETEARVMQSIEHLGREKTILIIAHRLSTVQNCDNLYFLKNGCIIGCGTYDELIRSNEKFLEFAQSSLVDDKPVVVG